MCEGDSDGKDWIGTCCEDIARETRDVEVTRRGEVGRNSVTEDGSRGMETV